MMPTTKARNDVNEFLDSIPEHLDQLFAFTLQMVLLIIASRIFWALGITSIGRLTCLPTKNSFRQIEEALRFYAWCPMTEG